MGYSTDPVAHDPSAPTGHLPGFAREERMSTRPSRHPQPFFWRSWSMRRFCRSVARG